MSKTEYLQRRHQTWYVVLEVPKKFRAVLGRRLLRSLQTQSLDEANRKKHAVIAEMKRQLDALARAPNQVEAKALAKAMDYRREFLAASSQEVNFPDTDDTISSRGVVIEDIRYDWEQLREKSGEEVANRFIKLATAEVTPIAGLPEQWLAEVKRQVSGQTLSQHESAIRRFIEWAGGEHISVEEITRLKAGAYLGELLASSGLKAKTLKRHFSSLSAFWTWLKSRGYAQDNPFEGHKFGSSRKAPRTRKGLADAEIRLLLSGSFTQRYNDTLHDVLRLALVTGARLDELCDLKHADVERREDGWWITIREGKTEAAARSVPLHGLVDAITEKRVTTKTPYLFQDLIPGGPDEKRMWYVSKAFRRYRDKVGVNERWKDFHALRNTFIEAMEGADVPESTVKLLVGHKRESMTFGHYSKGTRVDLRSAINRLTYAIDVMELIRKRPASSLIPNAQIAGS
jgi:integrase